MKKQHFIVFALLLVCLLIYVFYRPEGTLVNILLREIFPNEELLHFKEFVRLQIPLNEIAIYSLPGGLWVYSATIMAKNLDLNLFNKRINLEWLPATFALWLELLQYFGLVKGRFDLVDILLVVIFGLLAKISFPTIYNQHQMFKPFTKRGVVFLLVFVSVFMAHVFE